MAIVRDLSGNNPYLDEHIAEPGGAGGGGDASAANQVTANTKLDTIITRLETVDSSLGVIDNSVQETNDILETPTDFLPPTPLGDGKDIIHHEFQFSSAATHSLVALDTDERPLVYEIHFDVAAGTAGTITISDGTTEFEEFAVTTAGGRFERKFDERSPAWDTVINKQLSLIASAAFTIKGGMQYVMGPA